MRAVWYALDLGPGRICRRATGRRAGDLEDADSDHEPELFGDAGGVQAGLEEAEAEFRDLNYAYWTARAG